MAGPIDYTKLIEKMYKSGIGVDDIVTQMKTLGVKMTKAEVMNLLNIQGDPNAKPSRQIPPEPPKTIAQTPTQENGEIKMPGRFKRVMKAIGDDTHEAFARTLEKRYGLTGKRLAKSIRKRRGIEDAYEKKDAKGKAGSTDKELTREIDKATQTIVGSIAHLGSSVEKVLSKVDYGVRNSTDRIVKELDRITDRLKQQEYKQTEEDAEAATTTTGPAGTGSTEARGGVGAALLAGGAAGLLGMGLGTGETKAAVSDTTSVAKEGKDAQIAAQEDTQNKDLEWKADKITFQADEAFFSSAFDRALAAGSAAAALGSRVGDMVGEGGYDPTGDSGSFRRSSSTRGRSGRYDYNGPDHVPGRMAKGKRAENQLALYKALKDQGYNDKQAKIIVANATGESIDNPANYHWDNSHMSGGIFQWDPSRSEAIKNKFGKYPWELSIPDQAAAFKWEVNNNPRFAATKKMLDDPNASDAQIMATMVPNFEAPADAQGQIQQRLGHLSGVNQLVERENKKQQDIAMAQAKGGQGAGDSGSGGPQPLTDQQFQGRTGPKPLTDTQFNGRFGPQPLPDSQFDARFGGPPKPLSDAQFMSRFDGNGAQIEEMSTQSKVDAEKPITVDAGKDKKEAPKVERTADDAQDDKDSTPPPTSREDHYKDFLGLGITKTPGLGL